MNLKLPVKLRRDAASKPRAGKVCFCAKQITYRPEKIKGKLQLGSVLIPNLCAFSVFSVSLW